MAKASDNSQTQHSNEGLSLSEAYISLLYKMSYSLFAIVYYSLCQGNVKVRILRIMSIG